MGSCQNARAALIDMPGIVRVHPYGLNGKVMVYISDKEAVDQESFAEALEPHKLRLRRIRAR